MNRFIFCILIMMCTNSFAQTSRDWLLERQRETGTNKEYAARRTAPPEQKREGQSIDELEKILVEVFITPPDQALNEGGCDAEISIEYAQMDDKVEVDAYISNQQCNSSHGQYAIRVSTRDKYGEKHLSNYEESWRLDNASETEMTLVYEIGSDVELLSARIRGNTKDFCTCVAAVVENIDTKRAEADAE